MSSADELLTRHLADLDDDAIIGIIDSSSAQADYLGRFPKNDREAQAMSVICGVVAMIAEVALIRRRTGVTL